MISFLPLRLTKMSNVAIFSLTLPDGWKMRAHAGTQHSAVVLCAFRDSDEWACWYVGPAGELTAQYSNRLREEVWRTFKKRAEPYFVHK